MRFSLASLRLWLRRARERRRAQRVVAALFRSPRLLAGTSLSARHAGRWVLLDHEEDGGRVLRVRFGIVRHPRPYSFSGQSHKVIEHWVFDVEAGTLERERGLNVTRLYDKDDDSQ